MKILDSPGAGIIGGFVLALFAVAMAEARDWTFVESLLGALIMLVMYYGSIIVAVLLQAKRRWEDRD